MEPKLICLDIDGTLTRGIGGEPYAGAAEALRRLRRRCPLRFVTNATSQPARFIAQSLRSSGLLEDPAELVTPALTARRLLPPRGHDRGLLLAEEASRQDFLWFREDPDGGTVLLATEAHGFTVAGLQPAFRALLKGAAFYAAQRNRYYRKGADLWTDLGPIAAFLGYASGREAENLGKPSALLFDAIASEAGVGRAQVVMVGDDAEFDAAGAVALGMQGVLVRTGKYRAGDEDEVTPRPSAVIDGVADLPRLLEALG